MTVVQGGSEPSAKRIPRRDRVGLRTAGWRPGTAAGGEVAVRRVVKGLGGMEGVAALFLAVLYLGDSSGKTRFDLYA